MSRAITSPRPPCELRIGGASRPSADGATMPSLNPASGEQWATIAVAGPADVEAAVRAAEEAFRAPRWRELSPSQRGHLLARIADVTLAHAEELATIEATDNGKLHREMRAQMQALPDWFRYFGGLADKIEGRQIPLNRGSVLNYTVREPVGVVAAIVPWNSPLLLTTMKLAPALAAGNTMVVKPSEHASVAILRAVELWEEEAGLPPGVVNVVTGGPDTGRALVEDPRVAKISFTGGAGAGAQLAATAGSRLIPCTLELGGKSANIVLPDADLDAAHAGVLAGIFSASGQTCVAGSRALVHTSIYDRFVGDLVARAGAVQLGDPFDPGTEMGPVATPQQLQKVETMVDAGRARGLEVLTGGHRDAPADLPGGFFYRPTILAGVTPADDLFHEEVFGPVLAVMPFSDVEEAIELANRTRYGLAAGVWTERLRDAHEVAGRLHAGTVWINTYRAIAFNSPFGGWVGKSSGLGRENGVEAIDAYLQTKSVWCELSRDVPDPFTIKV